MLEIEERMALPDLTESFVQVEANGSVNLAGRQTAMIFQVKRVISPKGTPYHDVGAEIVSGPAKGKVVFARVLAGISREDLLRAAGLEPDSVRNQLKEDDLVNKIVRITVTAEVTKVDGDKNIQADGKKTTHWTIHRFGWDVR